MAEHLLGLPLKHKHNDLRGIGADDHHREWGWADEWGWRRSIYVPYSKDGWVDKGKVLEKASSGWDSVAVHQPCVLRIEDIYRMYYTGRQGPWTGYARIGLATSSDGLNFTRYGADGKILNPPPGYNAIASPSVIYDVYEANSNKRYKMLADAYYAGWKPVYLYSSNGINWTFDSEITGLTNPKSPYILYRFGNAYFVFYRDSATLEVRLAVTRDFSTWYNHGIVLNKGAAGEWDDEGYGYLGIFWNLGVWYLVLQGADEPSPTWDWDIGMATSSDGFNWTKYPLNPIQENIAGTWCDTWVMQPCLLMVEDKFRLYCCGKDASGVFSIGRFDIEGS
ncbi:MAG: hypothetical protein ACE5KC_00410 [Candidatus Bathyarchaeia archaeon]